MIIRHKQVVVLSLLTTLLLTGCRSLPATWNGTWKLNKGKSQTPGPNVRIIAGSDGWYEINNGNYSYRFRCDSKAYPVMGGRTVECVRSSPTSVETVFMDHGRSFDDTKRELLNDGKAMQLTSVMTRSDGLQELSSEMFVRLSGASSLTGTWKSTSGIIHAPEVLITKANRSTLRLVYPSLRQNIDLDLNGNEVSLQGDSSTAGTTLAVNVENRFRLATIRKQNGRIVNVGTLSLSPSGRELIEEWWRPDNPNLRNHLTYEKQ